MTIQVLVLRIWSAIAEEHKCVEVVLSDFDRKPSTFVSEWCSAVPCPSF